MLIEPSNKDNIMPRKSNQDKYNDIKVAKFLQFLGLPPKEKNPSASALGKLSAKKRKELGHDSDYYKKLAEKRWGKKNS